MKFWDGSMSLESSASSQTGMDFQNYRATMMLIVDALLSVVRSVCTPDQGPQNPWLNVEKEGIEIILEIMDMKDRFIV